MRAAGPVTGVQRLVIYQIFLKTATAFMLMTLAIMFGLAFMSFLSPIRSHEYPAVLELLGLC
jgi:hypothetical protein